MGDLTTTTEVVKTEIAPVNGTASAVNGRMLWDGQFAEPELETKFRRAQQKDELIRALVLMGISAVGFLTFIPTDYEFLGHTSLFWWMLAMRLGIVLGTLAVMAALWRKPGPRRADLLVLGWDLAIAAAIVAVTATRPPSYTGHAAINVLSVFLTYSVVPLPLRWQMLPALACTVAITALGLWVAPWTDRATALVIVYSLFEANGLGVLISWYLQRTRRKQFLAFEHEKELREKLEQALMEIKTLRGILPICTYCKKVWNDAGFWEQVEVYVHNHTYADFSHGLCPQCARQHYPQIDWDKKGL